MKFFHLRVTLIFGLLCLGFGLVSAQDATPLPSAAEATPSPIPAKSLMPCPADVTPTTICDVIATKAEDMVGVWSVYFGGDPAFIRFNADGTWVTGNTLESTSAASVDGYPAGTSSFDADGVWSTLYTPLPDCQAGRYRVRIIMVGGKPVALNLGLVEDCFAPRQSDYGFTMLRAGD